MEKVKEKLPANVDYFEKDFVAKQAQIAERGDFISNDSLTPETPMWCPVMNLCTTNQASKGDGNLASQQHQSDKPCPGPVKATGQPLGEISEQL